MRQLGLVVPWDYKSRLMNQLSIDVTIDRVRMIVEANLSDITKIHPLI